jgi:hypothetical protein
LYAVLREVKSGELSEDEAITHLERSPAWVWTALDPDSKLLLVIDVGTCTLEMAQRVVHRVVQVFAPHCIPLCLTDGLKDDGTALLAHFGSWRQPARRCDQGPLPKPRWMQLPELLYAQVVKSSRRLVGVTYPGSRTICIKFPFAHLQRGPGALSLRLAHIVGCRPAG